MLKGISTWPAGMVRGSDILQQSMRGGVTRWAVSSVVHLSVLEVGGR